MLNGMLCPICKESLQMSERQGVEIDYCPECRGVWLDRGELQKLIDFSLSQADSLASRSPAALHDDEAAYPKRYRAPYYEEHRNGGRHDRSYDDRSYGERPIDSHPGYYKPKKRESWFSELFDFD